MNILIVDDHEALCTLMARHIESEAQKFVAASDCEERVTVTPVFKLADALEALDNEEPPDLVILDLGLRGESRGAKTLQTFQQSNTHGVPVVIFTGLTPDQPDAVETFRTCLDEYKARGVILKTASIEKMFLGLSRILSGEEWVSDEVFKALLKRATPAPTEDDYFGLTPRERDVARALTEGLQNKSIATKLGLSTRYVAQVTTVIYSKLGVRTRTQAAMKIQAAQGGSVMKNL